MKNPIMKFIKAKSKASWPIDEHTMYDHPIEVSNPVTNDIDTMYIQDVERLVNKDNHLLQVSVLHVDEQQRARLYVISKRCVAPPDCEIDWDTVQCATSISWQSLVTDELGH